MNVYICRELFFNQTAKMNSMHGFWMAIARLAEGSWFRATWWPFWDCGIPFEFTYAPLVPGLTAAWSGKSVACQHGAGVQRQSQAFSIAQFPSIFF